MVSTGGKRWIISLSYCLCSTDVFIVCDKDLTGQFTGFKLGLHAIILVNFTDPVYGISRPTDPVYGISASSWISHRSGPLDRDPFKSLS